MSEYGYIPESPDQSFGNNKGIFTPNDIYDLTRADKYTQYGQLELIQTQTVDDADHSEEIKTLQIFSECNNREKIIEFVKYHHTLIKSIEKLEDIRMRKFLEENC